MTEGKSDDNNMAMLAHILGIVVSIVGPLIIYLTAKDKPFAYSQSKEALNFQITILIGWVACAVLSFIGIGFILYPLVWILNLIFCIQGAMAASKGEAYKYPFAIRLVN
ncbi:MAG: DUF4870 domain-containing protein [Candidatus Berkelbacteria bacterium]|nr:DUF4870 domain-containing protein [Candidatus Berkelbacteria bacterium]